MGGIDELKIRLKLLDTINNWHSREDCDLCITGQIDDSAKERLAQELAIMFCNAQKLIVDSIPAYKPLKYDVTIRDIGTEAATPKKRGRPFKNVNR